MSSLITSPAYLTFLPSEKKKNVPHVENDVLGNASLLPLTFASSGRHYFQNLLKLFFPCIIWKAAGKAQSLPFSSNPIKAGIS